MLIVKKELIIIISFHTYVVITIVLVTVLSILLGIKQKHRLQPMAGMVITMFVSMNVGMTIGILFGSNYQGNLYLSTLLSIIVGAFIGALCGLTIGILPLLEGIMSGLMSGMMGAMLGEMVPTNEASTLVKIFLMISISSIFLFLILSKKDNPNSKIPSKRWLFKPISAFLIVCFYLLMGNNLVAPLNSTKDTSFSKQIHDMSNKNNVRSLRINTKLFQYRPSNISLNKNETVSLTLENSDGIEHDLEIKDFSIITSNKISHDHHEGKNNLFHLHAKANSSSELTFTPTKSGEFEFYCTIPGHKESGMFGLITVN